MKNNAIQIDDDRLKTAMEENVRAKAIKFGTEIIYREGENIVSEHPVTGRKRILEKSRRKLR